MLVLNMYDIIRKTESIIFKLAMLSLFDAQCSVLDAQYALSMVPTQIRYVIHGIFSVCRDCLGKKSLLHLLKGHVIQFCTEIQEEVICLENFSFAFFESLLFIEHWAFSVGAYRYLKGNKFYGVQLLQMKYILNYSLRIFRFPLRELSFFSFPSLFKHLIPEYNWTGFFFVW